MIYPAFISFQPCLLDHLYSLTSSSIFRHLCYGLKHIKASFELLPQGKNVFLIFDTLLTFLYSYLVCSDEVVILGFDRAAARRPSPELVSHTVWRSIFPLELGNFSCLLGLLRFLFRALCRLDFTFLHEKIVFWILDLRVYSCASKLLSIKTFTLDWLSPLVERLDLIHINEWYRLMSDLLMGGILGTSFTHFSFDVFF